jgi:general stress protein 26
MLTTQTNGGPSHTRPMLVHDVDASGWVWLITDRHSRKVCELSQNPYVTLAFQSKNGTRFVSVQGTGVVVRDDVKLRELWNPTLRSWFPQGQRDAEIVLIAVRVTRAEYWLCRALPSTRNRHGEGPADGRRHVQGKQHFDLHALPADAVKDGVTETRGRRQSYPTSSALSPLSPCHRVPGRSGRYGQPAEYVASVSR